MQSFFKYQFGYVNIDSNYIYLTSSGNWSETKSLKEKSAKIGSKNTWKNFRITGFIGVAIIIQLYLIFFTEQDLGFIAILGGGMAIYKLYTFFQTDLGPNFKIPIQKIISMEIIQTTVIIEFQNEASNHDFIELNDIELKGINILNELSLINKKG